MEEPHSHIASAVRQKVIEPVVDRYPGKRELVELIALAFCSADHLLIVGPPGTAKSEVASEMCARIEGRYFEYLLTRFTEPSEVFGPTDIRALREGEVRSHTEGMLPEADVAFLDEIFHAGSAILNTLLGVLNNGVFRRGQQTIRTPLISVLAAANHLVEDPTLRALQDRLTLRVEVSTLPDADLGDLLRAGWKLERARLTECDTTEAPKWSIDELRETHRLVGRVELEGVVASIAELIVRIRATGMFLSDRRVVKLQRLAAASALLCGRSQAAVSDLWPARYLWESEEDREPIEALVDEFIAEAGDEASRCHPLALRGRAPAELLAALGNLEDEVEKLSPSAEVVTTDRLHDRLFDIDRERRWCRPRSAEDRDRLLELEKRLGSLVATLEEKSTS